MTTKTTTRRDGSRTSERQRVKLAVGVVRADESLTVAAFCVRIGISRMQLSQMRYRGMKVRSDGGKYLTVLGSDYHEYLRQLPVAKTPTRRRRSKPNQPVEQPVEQSVEQSTVGEAANTELTTAEA